MKNSKGYLLLETAVICCVAMGLLLSVLAVFAGSIRQLAAQRNLLNALEACQLHSAGTPAALPPNWQVQEIVTGGDLKARSVQVLQGDKIICNLVQVEK